MKKLLLILLCLPMIGLGQDWRNLTDHWTFTYSFDNKNDDYKGNIQKVTVNQCRYVSNFGDYVKDNCSVLSDVTYIDENITKKIHYYDGKVDGRVWYKYDSSMNIISYSYLGVSKEEFIYKYDLNGNMVEKNDFFKSGGLKNKNIYKYDANGNMINHSSYYNSGELNYKTIYKYDSYGNSIEWIQYNGSGKRLSKTISKYGSKANRIALEIKFSELLNRKDFKFIYKYDSKGNKIKEYFYQRFPNEVDWVLNKYTTYKYNSNGKIFEKTLFTGGSVPSYVEGKEGLLFAENIIQWKDVFKYDSKGNIIEKVRYEGEALIPSIFREYIIVYNE